MVGGHGDGKETKKSPAWASEVSLKSTVITDAHAPESVNLLPPRKLPLLLLLLLLLFVPLLGHKQILPIPKQQQPQQPTRP